LGTGSFRIWCKTVNAKSDLPGTYPDFYPVSL
jgi:hypothetical protein